MYAREKIFLTYALLIISIIILCFIRYLRKNTEGFLSCHQGARGLSNGFSLYGYGGGYGATGGCLFGCGSVPGGPRSTTTSSFGGMIGRAVIPDDYGPFCSLNGTPTPACSDGYEEIAGICTKCPAGKFSTRGNRCSPCPVGTYSSATGAGSCTSCGTNKYTTALGSTSSGACLNLPAGATINPTGGFRCPSGSYSVSGSGVCTPCSKPTGTIDVRSPIGSSSASQCEAMICSPGYYRAGQICRICPAGKSGSGGTSDNCTFCAAGTYSSADGASSCTTCGPGKYTTGPNTKTAAACLNLPSNAIANSSGGFTCAAGYRQGQTSCTECGAGTYSTAGAGACTSCGDNKYTIGTRSTSESACLTVPTGATRNASGTGFSCGAGYSQNETGCAECGVGTFSTAGSSSCTTCGSGKYTTGTRSTSESACLSLPPNTISNPSGGYTCASGYYNNGTTCVELPPNATVNSSGTGYMCISGYYNNGTSCVELPANSSPNSSGTGFTCASGYYNNGTSCVALPSNATVNSAGTGFTCGAGYSQGDTACMQCGVGTYSAAGSSSCSNCGANKYTTGPGSTSEAACLTVPANATVNSAGTGFTCGTGFTQTATGCVAVPANATVNAAGTGFICEAGYSQSETGCTQCGVGTYSTAGSSSCTNCGADKYTIGPGSTSESACLSVPTGATRNSSGSGFSCGAGYSQNETGCAECGVGTFSMAGSSSCTTCGAGKYTTGTRSTSAEACLSLPPNATLNAAGTDYVCREGYYRNGTECVTVPPNATVNSSGTGFTCGAGYSQSASGCTQCGASTYSAAGSSSCSACAAGTYSMPGASVCLSAPANAVINSSGTGFTCNPGFYNNGTGCVPVPANATPNSSGSGFTCAANYSQSSTGCVKCGAGTYSKPGEPACTSCCTFATPAAAVAGGCPDSTRLVWTKNPAKCPSGSRANCCNSGFSTNTSCRTQGFWNNIPQFTDNHKRACTSGFANYGDGIDSIAQKRVKRIFIKA